ncbi:MAG: hypothetical protein KF888_03820 [Nitrosomonas sp.]|nr:hypothetical protein [Nitrosomonas sp.]
MQTLGYFYERYSIHFYRRYVMNKLTLLLSLIFLSLVFTGCSKQEGPAEKTGKKIDESIESSKEAIDGVIEKATRKIEEIKDASEGPAEAAGKEIDEAVEDLKSSASEAYEDAAEEMDKAGETLKEKADAARGGY